MSDFFDYAADVLDSVTNRKEKDKDIEDKFAGLEEFIDEQEKQWEVDRPDFSSDTPDYERMEAEEKSDDEIKAEAEKDLEGYKDSSLAAIEDETERASAAAEREKESAKALSDEKSARLEPAYEAAKKAVSDDVLKRGLARSSIAVNKQAELEQAKADEIIKINNAFTEAINKLDLELASLGAKREKALNDFNISYAANLTEKIQTLKAEQEKKLAEALKYNNSLLEKEYQDKITAKEKEANIYGKELDNQNKENELKGVSSNRYDSIYKEMCAVLDSLNPVDAREAVMKNPLFKNHLDDRYYVRLYDRYTR